MKNATTDSNGGKNLMDKLPATFKPEVRIYDSCGCIRVNLSNCGKVIEQHVFPSHAMGEAQECAAKMQEGVDAAARVILAHQS